MRVRILVGSFVLFTVTLVLVSARPSAQSQDPTSARALYALLTQGPRGGGGAAGGQQAGPKNLQVLPKDWTTQQVTTLMRTFTAGLGQQCTYCHVADRSSDENPHKGVARKMIAMQLAINDQFLKDVGEPAKEGSPKVTCYTCHRGQEKPLNAPPAVGGQQ